MVHNLRFGAIPAVLMALVVCVPLQAQTPEIDALRARAEEGDAQSQYDLGVVYSIGVLVPEDDVEAARSFRLTVAPRIPMLASPEVRT